MRGVSCSGKDTFINNYFPEYGNVLSSDDFRQMMFGSTAEQRHSDKVFKLMYELLESRLLFRAEWTVMNSTNLRIKEASTIIELCKKYYTPFTILSIHPPKVEELKDRNKKRFTETGIYIPEHVIERQYLRYFDCMEPFVQEAVNNVYGSMIEFNQNEEVLRHVR